MRVKKTVLRNTKKAREKNKKRLEEAKEKLESEKLLVDAVVVSSEEAEK